MVALFFLVVRVPLGAASRRPPPKLDQRRLLRAYKPHRTGAKVALEGSLTWSPDGRHAYYTVYEDRDPVSGEYGSALFSVRRDGTHIRKLYSWLRPGEHNPVMDQWSPDSSHILLLLENFSPASSVNADGITLIDIDPKTGERRLLSRALNGDSYTGEILARPGYYSFSPNGKHLLITLGSNRNSMTNKRLVRIDYPAGRRTLLTPFRMAAFDGRWSPDGKRIVYASLPDEGTLDEPPGSDQEWNYQKRIKRQHLYLMDADGRHRRQLTAQSGYFEEEPSWIEKGRKISFVRRETTLDQHRSLWTMRPDGTDLKRIGTLPPMDHY